MIAWLHSALGPIAAMDGAQIGVGSRKCAPDERLRDIRGFLFRSGTRMSLRSCGLLRARSHLPRLMQPALPSRRLRSETVLRPRAEQYPN